MQNATDLELFFLATAIMGLLAALFVTGVAAQRLIARMRSRRNGAVRLLAWERFIIVSVATLGLMAEVTLGIIATLAPPRGELARTDFEHWLFDVIVVWSPVLLLITTTSLTVIVLIKLAISLWLNRYYRIDMESAYTTAHHPHRRWEDPPEAPGTEVSPEPEEG